MHRITPRSLVFKRFFFQIGYFNLNLILRCFLHIIVDKITVSNKITLLLSLFFATKISGQINKSEDSVIF